MSAKVVLDAGYFDALIEAAKAATSSDVKWRIDSTRPVSATKLREALVEAISAAENDAHDVAQEENWRPSP